MKEIKETFRILYILSTTPPKNFRKLVTSQALSVLLSTQLLVFVPGFLLPIL